MPVVPCNAPFLYLFFPYDLYFISFPIYLRHDTFSRSMDLSVGDFMFIFLLDIISSPPFIYLPFSFMRLMLGLSFSFYGCNNRFALYTHGLRSDFSGVTSAVLGSGRYEEKEFACDRSENDAICIYTLYTIYYSMSDLRGLLVEGITTRGTSFVRVEV